MAGGRFALLVATDRYEDSGLSKLAAPVGDAEELADILRDPAIAGYQVTLLYNEPQNTVGRAIGDFYRNRKRGDLTLLYFSGHGLKDDYGRLYLAMTDTHRNNLAFTGVPGEQIRTAMDDTRSGQNILILDCCYAGAFPSGRTAKGDTAVHTLERFGGKGTAVLTSTDATSYSFEGNRLTGTGPPSLPEGPASLFTRFLIEGIKTGKADLDGDGDITLDELYSYVHDHVIEEQPQQRPKKKEDTEGRIYVASNVNWMLPPHIRSNIKSPYAAAKLEVLDELRRRYVSGNTVVRKRIVETVRDLEEDDSKKVSQAALTFLTQLKLRGPQRSESPNDLGVQARPARGFPEVLTGDRWAPVVVGEPIFDFEPKPPTSRSYRPDTVFDGWLTGTFTVRMASVRGYSHRYNGMPRQDAAEIAFHPETGAVIFAVADGVSSARDSHVGAAKACERATDVMRWQLGHGRVDFTEVVDATAASMVRQAAYILQQEEPDLAAVEARFATTLIAGYIWPEARGARGSMISIGDSSAWVLRGGRFLGDQKVDPHAEVISSGVEPLPRVPAHVTPIVFDLGSGDVLLIGTDGFGVPLGDGDGEVGQLFARHLTMPPSPRALAHLLDFSRETFDDDRTLVAVWQQPRETGEQA